MVQYLHFTILEFPLTLPTNIKPRQKPWFSRGFTHIWDYLGGVFDIRGWDYKILKHWDAAKSTDNGPRRKSTCTIIYCNHLQSNNLCDHPQRWLGPEASTQRVQLKAMLVIGSTGLVSCGASLEVLKLNHYEDCHLKHGFLQPHMGECETAIACKSGYTVQVQSH